MTRRLLPWQSEPITVQAHPQEAFHSISSPMSVFPITLSALTCIYVFSPYLRDAFNQFYVLHAFISLQYVPIYRFIYPLESSSYSVPDIFSPLYLQKFRVIYLDPAIEHTLVSVQVFQHFYIRMKLTAQKDSFKHPVSIFGKSSLNTRKC